MNNDHSEIKVAQDGVARALRILNERLWHFTSVGLGNCRAAQRVRREIDQLRTAAVLGRSKVPMPAIENLSSHCTSHVAAPEDGRCPDHALANQTNEQLTTSLAHLESVGLGNSRAAQAILRELNEQLLIQSASLLANAGFDSNEPRDSHGQWATTGTATNRPTHANTAHTPDHPGANDSTKPKTVGTGAKPAPAATHHAEKTPSSTNALGTHAKKTKPPTRIAGIVYNETSGIYPALKPGAQVGGVENWSPESRKALNEAREQIAEIANAREKRVASSVAPNPKHQTPVGKAQWQDSLDAATRAEGKKSDNHFVIWPSTDGKAPTEKPRMQKDWPYDYKKNITAAYGPFRVPIKVGDVPAGSNIYIFFYKDVP